MQIAYFADLEDQKLWKGITELGLIDEFFREIKANLDVFKNAMVRRYVPLAGTCCINIYRYQNIIR